MVSSESMRRGAREANEESDRAAASRSMGAAVGGLAAFIVEINSLKARVDALERASGVQGTIEAVPWPKRNEPYPQTFVEPTVPYPSGVAPTVEVPPLDPAMREFMGKLVRAEWERWAREQPNPKPSWLTPWDQLTEPEREVDRRIAETIWRFSYVRDAAGVLGTSTAIISTGANDDPSTAFPSSAGPASCQPRGGRLCDAASDGGRDGSGGRDERSGEQPGSAAVEGNRRGGLCTGEAAQVLTLLPRIDAAIERITTGTADLDLVLADCKRLLRHVYGVPVASVIPESAILHRMKYHFFKADPTNPEDVDDWELFDPDIDCEHGCIDVLIVRADAVGVAPTHKPLPFDRAAVFTIWQGMQYLGGITTREQAEQFAQQVLDAHGVKEGRNGI
jgi:hypothetical protein